MEYPRECDACVSIFCALRACHRGCVFHHRDQIHHRTFCKETILTWCINEKIDMEMVKWIIQYFKMDVNERDERGCSAIELLLMHPSPPSLELANWLLTQGLDLKYKPIAPHEYPTTAFYNFCRIKTTLVLRPEHPYYEQQLSEFRVAAQFFIFNGADSSTIQNGEFNRTVYEITKEPYKQILAEVIKEYEYMSLPKEPC